MPQASALGHCPDGRDKERGEDCWLTILTDEVYEMGVVTRTRRWGRESETIVSDIVQDR